MLIIARSITLHMALWARTAKALRQLGNDTIAPILLTRYEQAQGVILDKILIKAALAEFNPPQLVSKFIENGGDSGLWRCITKANAGLVLDALESDKLTDSVGGLITTLSEFLDTAEDVARLLRLLLRYTSSGSQSTDTCARALEHVSRQARVRVFADGRVVPIER